MRVLLSTYGSRGDVEPMVALAVRLQELGAEVRCCAPPDEEFRELLTRGGVPLVPFPRPWRSWQRPPSAEERRRRVADFISAQYATVADAAAGCDVIVATAMSQFVGPSVAEKLGIPYRYVLFCPDVLDGLDGKGFDELFGEPVNAQRATIGLPPVGDVGRFMFTARPLLAADPILGPWLGHAGFDVMQTGAWILPDERPLPAELLSFLDAGEPPVYVGFGSMRTVDGDTARAAIEAILRRIAACWSAAAGPAWVWWTTEMIASSPGMSTNRSCSRAWLPSCTTEAQARRPRQPAPARRRSWCPKEVTRSIGAAGWRRSASARLTTVRCGQARPCQPPSRRLSPPAPAHGRPRSPLRSAPAGR
jgi:hypothetical protein